MASKSRLTPVSSKELKKIAGLATPGLLEARFPPSGRGGTDARAALRKWQDQQPVPEAPRNSGGTVRAVEPTSPAISRLVKVLESGAPAAEMGIQRLDEESFTGTAFFAAAAD